MAFVSSALVGRANKIFTLEVPNFMEEAHLLLASKVGRTVSSNAFEFRFSDVKFTGNIKIRANGQALEVWTAVQPACKSNHIGMRTVKVSSGSFDAKCVLNATLQSGDFHWECFKECLSYGSVKESVSHITKSSIQFDQLEQAVPDRLKDKVSLRVTANVTIFQPRASTDWVETKAKSLVDCETGPAPILRRLLSRQNTDLVVECEGFASPVHSTVLKCMSPVFTIMLNADMKEAKLGRIKFEDVGSRAVERMLYFMYTGKLFATEEKEPVTDQLIIELLHCADKYEIAEMKASVLAEMKAKQSTVNAVKFAQAAELYGAEKCVLEEILDFCKMNLSELPKGPQLQEFVVKNIKNLY